MLLLCDLPQHSKFAVEKGLGLRQVCTLGQVLSLGHEVVLTNEWIVVITSPWILWETFLRTLAVFSIMKCISALASLCL